MALSSMTGFARGHGVCGSYTWAWEIKSVNGKGLDLRLRIPSGWDAIEVPARRNAAEALTRGSVQAGLTVDRTGAAPVVRVNTAVLDAVLTTIRQLGAKIEASPPSIDGLLALKGVIEVGDSEEREDERHSDVGDGVEGADVKQQRLHELRDCSGGTDADGNSDSCKQKRGADEHPLEFTLRRAQCHPDADLAGALRHRV